LCFRRSSPCCTVLQHCVAQPGPHYESSLHGSRSGRLVRRRVDRSDIRAPANETAHYVSEKSHGTREIYGRHHARFDFCRKYGWGLLQIRMDSLRSPVRGKRSDSAAIPLRRKFFTWLGISFRAAADGTARYPCRSPPKGIIGTDWTPH